MPWKETSAMEQRPQLIADWLSGDYTKSKSRERLFHIARALETESSLLEISGHVIAVGWK